MQKKGDGVNRRTAVAAGTLLLWVSGCSSNRVNPTPARSPAARKTGPTTGLSAAKSKTVSGPKPVAGATGGVPPLLDPQDVYAADRPGMFSPVVRRFPERVYVPNCKSDTVDVIDPARFKIVDHFRVGKLPQ